MGQAEWSRNNNWAGSAPSANTTNSYVFGGNLTRAELTPNNGLAGMGANSILFAANATNSYNLIGTNVNMVGGMTNLSTLTQTNSMALTLVTNQVQFNTASNNITLAGVIGGSGQLVKVGASTLFLTAANTYTNATVISAGTLQVGQGTDAGSISASTSITNNGALIYNVGAGLRTNSAVISGTGTLAQSGTGTLTLGGVNTYTGTTTINSGAIVVTNASALGATNAGTVVVSGGQLGLSGGVTIASEALSLAGTGIASGGALRNVSGTNVYSGAITLTNAARINSDAGLLTLNNAGGITGAGLGLTLGGAGNINVDSAISTGSGSLTKDGAGTATLSGANNYSGGTLVSAGTLRGSTASLQGNITNNAGVIFDQAADGTYSNVLSGTGTLQKLGAATLTTTGANTFSGATTVSTGRLVVDGTNASSAVTVNSGASLGGTGRVGALTVSGLVAPGNSVGTLSASNTVFNPAGSFELEIFNFTGTAGTQWDLLAVSGNLTLSNTSVSPFTINLVSMTNATTPGLATFDARLNYTNTFVTYTGSLLGTAFNPNIFAINTNNFQNAASGTFSVITNAGGLALLYTSGFNPNAAYTWTNGSGNWSLASGWTNGFAPTNGSTVIFSGGAGTATNNAQVSSLASATFSNTTGSIVLAGDAFAVGTNGIANLSANSHTVSNNISLSGAATFNAASNNLTFAGNVTNGGSLLTVAGNNNTAISGAVSGTGGLTKSGTGTLTLSGANTYSGGTAVNAGTVSGDTTSIQGNVTNNASVVFNQATNGTYAGALTGSGSMVKTNAGTLTLTGANSQSGTTVGQGTLQIGNGGTTGSLAGPITNNGTLAFNRSDNLTQSDAITGTGNLTKQGGGTLTLTAANTQSGTTVSAGTLQIGSGGTTGSLAGRITNDASLVFNRSDNLTQSDAITGTGNLTKQGGGTLTLTAANTQSGTTVSAGTLQVGNGGTTGSLAGPITNNASLVFNRSDNLTQSDAITGTGNLTKQGGGTLTLTGANSQSGTTVSAGTLQIGNGGTTGSLAGPITNNATLAFNRSDNLTQSGNISGTGTLNQNGSGTLTLAGTNTYSGGTLVSAGALAGDTTSLQGNITNNASVIFNQGTNGTYAGALSGSGALTKNNAGTLTLTGANSQSGTTVSAGTLQVGNGGTTGSLAGPITNNASLVFNRSDNLTQSDAITGTGNLTKQGGGTLTLTAANTQSGTTVSAGTLQIGNGGATGSLAGPITNNATLAFNRSDNLTQSGNISGTGTLNQNGSGTLTLAGTNTYSGGTLVSAGTLAGNTTSLQGNITNNAAVIFNQAAAGTYVGTMSGTGALTKDGAGTLTTTGNNTFSGATAVDAGRLVVNGTNANSAVTVAGVASLSGSGTVGDLTVSGLVAPGNGVGTLSAGNTFLNGGGAFDLEMFNWTGSAGTGWDLLAANGNLTLNNTAGSPFTINLISLSNSTTAGLSINFNPNQSYTNNFITFTGSLLGTAFNPNIFAINTNNFQNTVNGSFSVVTNGSALALVYTTFFDPAAAYVWTNGSGNWSLASGWTNNVAPTNGSTVIFSAGAGTATNNAQVSSLASVTFSNTTGSIVLAGSAFAIGTNGIANLSGNAHTISNNISLAGASTINAASNNLTIAGNVTNAGSQLTVDGAANTSIGGVVSGTGGLTKDGSGTLTLAGANSYSGGTAVNAGTLAGNTTSLQGNITNDASVVFNQSTNGTYAGNLTGAGNLTKNSAGTLTLTGANSQGGTTIAQGTVQVGNGGTTGSLDGNVTNNGTLAFNRSDNLAQSGDISGSGNLTKSGAGTVTLGGVNTYSGGTTVNAGALAGDTSSLQGAITNNASVIFDQTSSGTYAGTMSGTGALTKNGTGTVTLSGPNTYSGGTLVSAGAISGDTSSIQGNVTNTASVIFNQATNGTYAGNMSGSGALTKDAAGTLTLAGVNTYSGGTAVNAGAIAGTTTSIQGAITNNGAVIFNQNTSGTYAGNMSGSGALTMQGNGTLTLSGANTYSGGTLVTGGTLAVSSDGNLGSTNSTLTLSNGTLLSTASFTIDSGRSISILGTNGTIDVTSLTELTYNGDILGSAQLTKAGLGTLSLGDSDIFTGPTFVSAGTLNLTTPNALSNSIVTVASNATLINSMTNADIALGNLEGSGSVDAGSNNLIVGNDNVNTTFSGTVSVAGTNEFVKTGTGTMELSGTISNPTGTTVIDQGAIKLAGSDRLDTNGALNVALAGTLDLNTNSQRVGGLTGTGTITNSGGSQASLEVFVGGGTNQFAGTIGGSTAVQKTGGGAFELTGLNNYNGDTTVAGGFLQVTGSASNSLVIVQNTATLSGGGTIGGLLVETGGTVSPGSSPGTLPVVGGVTWEPGGNYNWQVFNASGTAGAPSGWDLITAGGQLDLSLLSSTNRFNVNLWSLSGISPDASGPANFNANQSYTWNILTAAGGINNFSADKFNLNAFATNGTGGFVNNLAGGSFGITTFGNALQLTFTPGGPSAIPEPGTWAAAIMLAGAAAYARLRRRRAQADVADEKNPA